MTGGIQYQLTSCVGRLDRDIELSMGETDMIINDYYGNTSMIILYQMNCLLYIHHINT